MASRFFKINEYARIPRWRIGKNFYDYLNKFEHFAAEQKWTEEEKIT